MADFIVLKLHNNRPFGGGQFMQGLISSREEDYEKARSVIMEDVSAQPFWESTSCQKLETVSLD